MQVHRAEQATQSKKKPWHMRTLSSGLAPLAAAGRIGPILKPDSGNE